MTATVAQLSFITKLVNEREVDDKMKTSIFEIARRPDATSYRGGDVSQLIDGLLKLPRRGSRTQPAQAAAARENALVAAGVPCARYVLERDEVPAGAQQHFGGNDVAFYEVREFKGVRYLRQLHGAPGSYSRSRMRFDEQREVVAALAAVGPLKATQRYSRMYSVCSCCGAELTDQTSRETGLGPVCRRRFGL